VTSVPRESGQATWERSRHPVSRMPRVLGSVRRAGPTRRPRRWRPSRAAGTRKREPPFAPTFRPCDGLTPFGLPDLSASGVSTSGQRTRYCDVNSEAAFETEPHACILCQSRMNGAVSETAQPVEKVGAGRSMPRRRTRSTRIWPECVPVGVPGGVLDALWRAPWGLFQLAASLLRRVPVDDRKRFCGS
jgi:hypothetical protein